jgi:hypothetical protein
MANRLIRIEDMASITTTAGSPKGPPAQLRPNPTSPTHTAPPYQSAIPGLAPAPGAPLSPRTAAMVLEAAGKTDGDMLVKNAKDFAATIRQLKKRNGRDPRPGPRSREVDSTSCLATKRTSPRPATIPVATTAAAAPPPTTNQSTKACAPSDSRRTQAKQAGFYIPDDDGNQQEPKFVRFVQGANPHAEGNSRTRVPHLPPPPLRTSRLRRDRCPLGPTPYLVHRRPLPSQQHVQRRSQGGLGTQQLGDLRRPHPLPASRRPDRHLGGQGRRSRAACRTSTRGKGTDEVPPGGR